MNQIHYQLALTRRDELLRHAEERRRVDQGGRSPDASSNVTALVRRLKPAALRLHRALRKRAAERSHDGRTGVAVSRAAQRPETSDGSRRPSGPISTTRRRLANEQ